MSEENTVRKIREATAPTVEVPAIGSSFTTNLGGDRQIVLQTHVPGDCSDAQFDAVLDRMLRAGDRLKARYDLEKLESEFQTTGIALGNLIDGLPHGARNYAAQKVETEETIIALREQHVSIRDTAYEDFTKSGKRGTFALKGHAEANARRVQQEIEKNEERLKMLDAETEKHRQDLSNSIVHYRQQLGKLRVKINELRATAGMPPNNEFIEFETCKIEGL